MGNTSKKHPFKVPENYFGDLESQIKSKVENKDGAIKIKSIRTDLFKVAASVLFIMAIGIVLYNTTNDDQVQVAENTEVKEILKEIPDEAIIKYLAESNMEIEELIEFAATKNINDAELDDKSDIEEEILKDYIDNYL
ncbi:hypothetical protein [Mangrovivirga cuniculi]|uniref:Uncharacterized protein n=1 Tax=Mangrovivirga cuniculi TaxID=2715131 RepID=A0A4D7JUL4_9BACT|nr:hypothetical protein [Mangrovivirga cuniculi]QCK15866.1 hypothetical protein DCC35_14485 [Mangrovivirga cuniculi]